MIVQLAAIHAYGLLESDEVARFTPRTQSLVESLSKGALEVVRAGG
jgi:hypothetical protein